MITKLPSCGGWLEVVLRGCSLFLLAVPLLVSAADGQSAASALPEVTVISSRVANQAPAGTFAMPVSALRYEPLVDIQSRNLGEGQADVTLRGGTFEATGFQVGGATWSDPQTGHYLAEIPVAPAMLLSPQILTGADLALRVSNPGVGAVAWGWRSIRTVGAAELALGDFGLRKAEIYQGVAQSRGKDGGAFGADVAVARSESNGSRPFGEHRFDRANVRLQHASGASQTDIFAGYQAKFFGWPNLYTPFNSNETENLQTVLLAVNHRTVLGAGDFVEAAAYHRRNKDDYAFNRFAPLGVLHPFQHTTRVEGAAVGGRISQERLALGFRGEVSADELKSTSLTAGRYRTRTISKVALVPEYWWGDAGSTKTTLRAGGSWDDSNRDGGAFSPIVEWARERKENGASRLHVTLSKTSQLPSYTALNSSASAGLFRGNPNLGRQRSTQVEAGWAGSIDGWRGESTVFWRRDDALVDWTFRRGVTARTASPVDVDTVGLEAVARRSWERVELVLGFTELLKEASYRGAVVDASFYALNYARLRFTAAVSARLGGGFEVHLDNNIRVQADNLLRISGGDSAVISSLGLIYRPPNLRRWSVSGRVDNPWNSAFQEVPAVPAARRQASVGVGFAW